MMSIPAQHLGLQRRKWNLTDACIAKFFSLWVNHFLNFEVIVIFFQNSSTWKIIIFLGKMSSLKSQNLHFRAIVLFSKLTSYGNFVVSSGGGWGWSLPLQTRLMFALTMEFFGSVGSRLLGWLSTHLLHIQWASDPPSSLVIRGCKIQENSKSILNFLLSAERKNVEKLDQTWKLEF